MSLIDRLPPGDEWMHLATINPEFEKAERVHDWRNHVPDALKAVWEGLSYEGRLVAVIMANAAAEREEWE